MLAPQKESIFGRSCRLWLLSWRRARIFARSCSLLSKYLPISWKQRKEQSHAQCHVTHRIRIFDKISEHVKVAKSVDIAVPELAVTKFYGVKLNQVFLFFPRNIHYRARPKGPYFQFFFDIARLFFRSFCDKMDVEKSQKVLPVSFFGIVRLFKKGAVEENTLTL